MNATDSVFQEAVAKLLREVFNGPPADEAYLLNPGDPGLLRQLEIISAAAASTPPSPGRSTIAAHVHHVHYGLSLINRWVVGEEDPWAGADWKESWQHTRVTEAQWRKLLENLKQASAIWQDAASKRRDWALARAADAISIVAHTAYHLGAIRQILVMTHRSENTKAE